MTLTLAITNQKGGVGKTTITIGLAAAVARRRPGHRVLVIDLDPQANATAALEPMGFRAGESLTTSDVLHTATVGCAADAIRPSGTWLGVDVIPAELALATRQNDGAVAGEVRLRRSLTHATDVYDLVLIDCPPSLGPLSVNALVAADQALIVTEPALASVQAISEVLRTVTEVTALNPQLRVGGIVLNKVAGTREAALRVNELQQTFGAEAGGEHRGLLLWPQVPAAAAFAESYGAHTPVQDFPSGRRAELEDVLNELALAVLR